MGGWVVVVCVGGGWLASLYINENISPTPPAALPEVSPLMQLCRLLIRRTVGKRRLTGINELHLPADIKRYLLYRSNAGEPTH